MIRDTTRPVILLAEDSEDDAYMFRWVARKVAQEYDLVCVPDGREAVRVLATGIDPAGQRQPGSPDVLFLDLKMPMLSGFEVLQWLQSHPISPSLPVAVLSGSDQPEDIDRALRLGAMAFFTKPISAPKLAAFLATCHPPHRVGVASPPARGPADT